MEPTASASPSLEAIGRDLDLPLLASGDVHMHVRQRRELQDALTAIRSVSRSRKPAGICTRTASATCASANAWRGCIRRELLAETMAVAARMHFSLDELRYEYPHELVPEGETPTSHLRKLTEEGARRRWPKGVPPQIACAPSTSELALIAELRYEPYFLTVHDIVEYARAEKHPLPGPRLGGELGGVLLPRRHGGRSGARRTLLFERFISARAQRAARHRHRFRARAARGGHPVHLPASTGASGRRSPPRSSCIGRAARCATWARRSAWIPMQCGTPRRAPCSGGTAARRSPSGCARRASIPTTPSWHGCCCWRTSSCGFPASRAICRSTSAAS